MPNQILRPGTAHKLACIASVSARVRRESWDESKKKLSRYNLTGNVCYAGFSQIEDTPSILQTFLRGKQQGF